MALEIPYHAKTYELSNSVIWMEDGILYSSPKLSKVKQTREVMLSDLEIFQHVTDGKKVPIIAEAHRNPDSPPKEDRDFIAEKLELVTEALALITTNEVNKIMANIFFLFKPARYPMKMFTNVEDARLWLKSEKVSGRLMSL